MTTRTTRIPARPVQQDERLERNVIDDNVRRIPDRPARSSAIVENKKTGNSFELGNEEYQGGTLSKEKTTITGQGSAQFKKELNVSGGYSAVHGCVMTKPTKVESSAIFTGSRFEDPVNIEAGGKAIFNGCVFSDDAFVTSDAANAVTDVVITGCIRQGTPAHVNCTVLGEVVV